MTSARSHLRNGRVRYTHHVVVCAVLLALVLLVGCDDSASQVQTEKDWTVSNSYQQDDLQVTVQLSQDELGLADDCYVRWQVAAPMDYALEWPGVIDAIEPFTLGVLDSRREPDRLDEQGRRIEAYTYRFEPMVSGELVIESLTFIAAPRPASGGAEAETTDAEPPAVELTTEPILLKVATLDPEKPEDAQLADIKGVVTAEPPAQPLPTWAWFALGGGAVVLLAVVILLLRRRPRQEYRRIIPAHQAAREALNLLSEQNLLLQGQTKDFYETLNLVLRRYIEHRFDLRAPELTTEEFLVVAGGNMSLSDKQKMMLKSFLGHCDQVKYARYAPSDQEVQQTLSLAEDFIDGSADLQRTLDVTDSNPLWPRVQKGVA